MKKVRLLSLFLAFTLLLALAACGGKEDPTEAPDTAPGETPTAAEDVALPRNPLTGAEGYDEALLAKKGVAVVVENHPQARPQWGFTTPDVVMEYEVEGGISRMLWLYANPDALPDKLGPVRSARHDVVELAYGMGMLFVHCGGSPQALDYIKTLGESYSELDGLSKTKYFSRDTSRGVSQEHTLTLSRQGLADAIAAMGIDTARDPDAGTLFGFAPEGTRVSPAEETGAHVRFQYSGSYVYDFDYDAAAGKYLARLNSKAQTDENGTNTAYTNVLILYVDMVSLGDSDGHQDLLLEKGGTGVWLSGGRSQSITWDKTAKDAPLRLFAQDGAKLMLNVGNSYIGFVRSTNADKTVIS